MKREITSKNLKQILHGVYHGLNLYSVLNILLYLALAFLMIKTNIFSRLFSGPAALLITGAIFMGYSLNSQYKKMAFKNALGQELDEDQWKRFNREMENRSTRVYGDPRSLTMVVLTRSFLFFPSKTKLVILPLEEVISYKKVQVEKKSKKDKSKSFIEIITSSASYSLSNYEELYKDISLKTGIKPEVA